MNTTGELRAAGGARYALAGEVTLATVTALRERGLRAFGADREPIEVNLAEVQRADSGALALLVDWLAWARAAGRELRYTALPAPLLALARLSDVEDLLTGR